MGSGGGEEAGGGTPRLKLKRYMNRYFISYAKKQTQRRKHYSSQKRIRLDFFFFFASGDKTYGKHIPIKTRATA